MNQKLQTSAIMMTVFRRDAGEKTTEIGGDGDYIWYTLYCEVSSHCEAVYLNFDIKSRCRTLL